MLPHTHKYTHSTQISSRKVQLTTIIFYVLLKVKLQMRNELTLKTATFSGFFFGVQTGTKSLNAGITGLGRTTTLSSQGLLSSMCT